MNGFLLAAAASLLAAQVPPTAAPGPTRAVAMRPLGSLFSMDDYPLAAFQGRAEGVVHFILVVDTGGLPSQCIVTRSSSNPALDRATCDILMARARFSPARDENGRAVEDRVSSRVRWAMPDPEDQRLSFIPVWMLSEVTVAGDGSLRCRDRVNVFEDPDDSEGCGAFTEGELAEVRQDLGANGSATLIVTIVPDGAARPAGDGVDRGEPVMAGTARLSVAPDGHLADCRVTRRPDPGRRSWLGNVIDLCRLPLFDPEQMFRPDIGRTEVRGAMLELRVYLRRDPSS